MVGLLVFVAVSTALAQPAGQPVTVAQLEQQVKDSPSLTNKSALAEGYLRDCQLDKSLTVWQEVLKTDPTNERAKLVVTRLTAQGLDLDNLLAVLADLIDKGERVGIDPFAVGIVPLLDKVAERAATDEQKATVLYLRGRVNIGNEGHVEEHGAEGVAHLQAACKLYPHTAGGARSAIALALVDIKAGQIEAGQQRLADVVADKQLTTDDGKAARQEARLQSALLVELADATAADKIAGLRKLVKELTDKKVVREALAEIMTLTELADGRWTPDTVDAAVNILENDPPAEEAMALLRRFDAVARTSQDASTLKRIGQRILVITDIVPGRWNPSITRQAGYVLTEAAISYSVLAEDVGQLHTWINGAIDRARELALPGNGELHPPLSEATAADRQRSQQIIGRALLVEAQKLATLKGPTFALPALLKARDHYLGMMGGGTGGLSASVSGAEEGKAHSGAEDGPAHQLGKIGKLLEQIREWETAIALYRQVATQFPQLPAGRDSLLRVAQIYDTKLDAPLAALDVYAEYSARYPAELPYRQLALGERLKRLGYTNLLDFQKRNSLKTDGLFGPSSSARLHELEASFDLIRVPGQNDPGIETGDEEGSETPAPSVTGTPSSTSSKSAKRQVASGTKAGTAQPSTGRPGNIAAGSSTILRGAYVHPAIFAIAKKLEQAGRHRDAIVAYRMFLNLFPTKSQANDCLMAVARLFREDLLFDEALGAYRQLISDYPKGSQTGEAYIEAAQCLENLGRWKEAKELYDLYVRNFPKYPRVALCKTRMGLLDEVIQYAEFVASNPANPKVAEAQYQVASLLYKEFGNFTKAAVEFQAVAEQHPQHVRAADGLFTAGTCQLKAENFPAARTLYGQVVANYPDSRLAGAAQYWIGHTYEYAARALGKLDNSRVVLKRRGLRGRAELQADAALRRFYFPSGDQLMGFGAALPSRAEVNEAVWGGDVLGVLTSGSKRDRVNADLVQAIAAYRKVVDQFKMSEMAGIALLRIGTIYTEYLNDPDKGAEAYRELLAHYPGSKEAVDALFEVGSYQVKQKKFDEAIKSYEQFMFNYPNEAKVEDAMMAIARCHADKQVWDKALDAYQNYLTKFPAGRFATQAKGQVEWIRMYHF